MLFQILNYEFSKVKKCFNIQKSQVSLNFIVFSFFYVRIELTINSYVIVKHVNKALLGRRGAGLVSLGDFFRLTFKRHQEGVGCWHTKVISEASRILFFQQMRGVEDDPCQDNLNFRNFLFQMKLFLYFK